MRDEELIDYNYANGTLGHCQEVMEEIRDYSRRTRNLRARNNPDLIDDIDYYEEVFDYE